MRSKRVKTGRKGCEGERGEEDAGSAEEEEEEESEGYDDDSLSSAEVDNLYPVVCKQFDGRDERLQRCGNQVLQGGLGAGGN